MNRDFVGTNETVHNIRVSVEWGCTVINQFLPVYLKTRLVTLDPSVY